MNPKALKYVLDIESAISELEVIQSKVQNDFLNFEKDIIAVRATERDFEIIGEALNNIKKIDSSVTIHHSKAIIGLRNLIAHAYDSVDNEILWGILVNHIPQLKQELANLKITLDQ
jgi:uncharacterized protein with HEPN domain